MVLCILIGNESRTVGICFVSHAATGPWDGSSSPSWQGLCYLKGCYPLVNVYIKLLKMAIEIV